MSSSVPTPVGAPSRLTDAFGRVDSALGDTVERSVRGHHRRRLRRVGWEAALDARAGFVAPHGFPPRSGNRLEVLVDGAVALPRIANAIGAAERSVALAGWFFSPAFELSRGDDHQALVELLRQTAERGVEVRLLAWAGAPLPLFRPGRRQVEAVIAELADGTGVRAATDRRERPMHCHPETLVIVDGLKAFVGGIELSDLAGDRFDSIRHPLRNALAGGDRRAAGPSGAGGAHGGYHGAARANGARTRLPQPPARRLFDPGGVCRGPARGAYSRVSREPVPVVERDRRNPRGPAPEAALRRVSDGHRAARAPEHGRGRHPRSARGPPRGRCGRPAALLHARRAGEWYGRGGLRPRQDRHRRRPLADPRVGEPQRALALQRHGGEPRRRQPGVGRDHATPSVGRAPRAVARRGRR